MIRHLPRRVRRVLYNLKIANRIILGRPSGILSADPENA